MADVTSILARADQMVAARAANWDSHFEQVRNLIHPRTPSFTGREQRGNQRRTEILDNSAETYSHIFAAALHGLLTNPSQEWFALRASASRLNQREDVRRWLDAVTDLLLQVFRSPRTQFAVQIARMYRVLGDFGTSPIYIQDRPGDLPLFQALPLAQTYVAENHEGVVDRIVRRWDWPASTAFQAWGEMAGAEVVAAAKDPQKAAQTFTFLHAIFPREDAGFGRIDNLSLPFASVIINVKEKHQVEESGFHEQPVIVPRWQVSAGEDYGRGPGMAALPDVTTLQRASGATIRAAEKAINPPLMMADDGIMQPVRTGEGQLNYVRQDLLMGRQPPIQPMPTGARPDMGEDFAEAIRSRIRDAFFIPMLQIARDPRMTATQVLKIDEEQQRILGPAIGRLQTEAMGPMITRTYGILERAGAIPPAPPDLAATGIEVEYVSPLVKAQRLSEVSAYNQWVQMMLPVADIDPTVLDIADFEGAMRAMADRLNVPVEAVRSTERVAELRQARALQQEADAMADQAMKGAAALQSVSQATQGFNNDNNAAAA